MPLDNTYLELRVGSISERTYLINISRRFILLRVFMRVHRPEIIVVPASWHELGQRCLVDAHLPVCRAANRQKESARVNSSGALSCLLRTDAGLSMLREMNKLPAGT